MAARRPVNLTRRQGVYYFRGFIPKAAHSGARRREVRVSLRTRDACVARVRLRSAALAFESLCGQLRRMVQLQAPDEDIRNAVQAFGSRLLAHALPPPSFAGPTIDYDHARARFWVQEEISALEYAVANSDFTPQPIDIDSPIVATHAHAKHIAQAQFASGSLAPERLNLLRSGIARAQLEERRHYLRRLDDPFATLVPADPLFGSGVLPAPAADSPTFSKAIASYVNAKSGVVWTSRTEEENRRILRLAEGHFGSKTPIASITLDSVRAFRDSVVAWKKKPAPTATLQQISNAPAGARIGPKTAAKYFQYVTAAFAYWTNEGFIEKSPVRKLSIHIPHQSKGSSRVPFSPSELHALFSSPIYTGCAGLTRRTIAGANVYRDGLYWALLIAPLSGMRITEIVQLALDDVCFSDEVPSFRIKADVDLGQHVKSDAGWRRVPVHRRLIELGFKDFVEARQEALKKGRLFHDIHVSGTGGSGGEFSKLFGRTMRRLGLKRPGLVFHSFRHGFVDALRELNAPSYVIQRLVGHASGSVTDGYGAGASLKTCREWIDKLTLLDALPSGQELPKGS